MVCDRCGDELRIGDYPFCPHGRGSTSIEDATWPGGRVFENMGDQPVRCDSPADFARECRARNIEPFVRHLPGDKHTVSWATTDPYTLENGRILAERQARTKATDREEPADPGIAALVKDAFERQGMI